MAQIQIAQAPKAFIPEVQTRHDGKIINQTFKHSTMRLSVDTERGIATAYLNDNEIGSWEGLTNSAWSNILYTLQRIVNG